MVTRSCLFIITGWNLWLANVQTQTQPSLFFSHTNSLSSTLRSLLKGFCSTFVYVWRRKAQVIVLFSYIQQQFFHLHPSQRPHALSLHSLWLPVLRSLHFWVLFTSLHFYLFGIVWFSAKGHHSLYESMHVSHYFLCGCSFCLPLSWCSIFWAGSLGYQCGGQQLLSNRWEHYHVKAKAMCCTPQQLERNV